MPTRATFLLFALLTLAVVLRLPYLATTPPWYTDEGFYLNVANEVAHGQWRTFGIEQWTAISPYAMNPPLFYILLAPLTLLFGKTLIAARVFTVLIGVATVGSLYYIGGQLFRRWWIGFISAAAYAILPEFVVNNRWIFPHGLTGLLLLWSWYQLWIYREKRGRRSLLLGTGCLAVAMLTHFWAWWFAPFAILFIIGKPWRWFWIGLTVAFLPPILFLVGEAIALPRAFLADLPYTLNGSLLGPVHSAGGWKNPFIDGVQKFFSRDILFIFAVFGLVAIRRPALRWLLLLATASVTFPLLLNRPAFNHYFYPALVFTPLLLLGLAGLIDRLLSYRWLGRGIGMALIVGFGTYLGISTIHTVTALANTTLARSVTNQPFIFQPDVDQMRAVANFVNARTTPTDFVIAPNNLNWQLKAFSVEPVWVACYEHRREFSNLWDERFTRPLAIDKATYAVDDTIFPGDASLCQQFRPEVVRAYQQWPVVFATDRFIIYKNPARPTSPTF